MLDLEKDLKRTDVRNKSKVSDLHIWMNSMSGEAPDMWGGL